jgi:hypothetical protein
MTGRPRVRPALAILLVAPFLGEGLSGATPPLDLVLPWNLALMVALYGCGALLCREVAHRFDLGFPGLCLLGAAYGVYEEALVDRYWFYPTFWHDSGVGTYSVVWHTNVMLAVHLTAFHTAISICSSVVVVEYLFPAWRERVWTGRSGLVVAAVALAAVPLVYGEFDRRPPLPVLAAAVAVGLLLVVSAFWVGRSRWTPAVRATGPRRGLGWVAFGCTAAHWVVVYGVSATGLPWPAGVALALAPVVVGVLVVPRLSTTGPYGRDGLRVVAGMVSFLVVIDVFVGLAGRYDLTAAGLATAYALHRLLRRDRGAGAVTDPASAR